jgi:hypothetical protein
MFRVICVICKKNSKKYGGDSSDDKGSWVCGKCYNELKIEKDAQISKLNAVIELLKSKNEPEIFDMFNGKVL